MAKETITDDIAIGEDILSMQDITKIYSNGFVANKAVNFSVRKGEIHGLVGENGAGKSTLMKVLFGQETPETGRILLRGKEVHIENPLMALDYGIGMVYQHFMLNDSLTVAENMVLGIEPKKNGILDLKQAIKVTEDISKKYNLPVNPKMKIKDISVGLKQRVEILKILMRGATILLLDEPTAVLTPQETEELFRHFKQFKEEGYTIVFVSHKLNEIKEICDRITVLRKGQSIATASVEDVTETDISRMMVGRDVFLTNLEKAPAEPQKPVLKIRDLSHIDKFGNYALRDISFDLRQNEILGVAGVEGNGQTQLSETISGLLPIQTGDIQIGGESIKGKNIRLIRETQTSLIHEDRMVYGVANTETISENLISDRYYKDEFNSRGILKEKEILNLSNSLIKEYTIKCDGPDAPVKTLSGGNAQKVIAAREFSSNPLLLIASHPTRVIDVFSTEFIRRKIV